MHANADKNEWSSLNSAEKNKLLYFRQKETLDLFLKLGAISQAQHDKSLHDLTEKMGVVSGEREASSRETDSCRHGEESET